MKKTLLVFTILLQVTTAFAQADADYDLAMAKFQTFYNNHQADSIFGMFGDKMTAVLPHDKAVQQFDMLNKLGGNLKSYTFLEENATYHIYKGEFEKMSLTFVLQLNKDQKLDRFSIKPNKVDTSRSNFNLKTATGTLYGSLAMPTATVKVPIVLLIAGSGPTDRDGNNEISGKSNTYLMIADSLQKAGIASVRYDKRGVGASMAALKSEESMSFEDAINDAIGFLKKIKADGRFSKVYILGHSEGSLIGMIAAQREAIDGFISVSGAGEGLDKTLVRQLSAKSKKDGTEAKIILDSIMNGYTVRNPNVDQSVFRVSAQPYMRSLLKYDPIIEIKKLSIPVLILQGDNDLQVTVDDAKNLKKAYPSAKLVLVDGMNHVLKSAPTDRAANFATYGKPDLPLCAGFMGAVVGFVTPNP